MAIVSCPECQKKLKVADTSVGKKVKCSCGQVFVADAGASAPAAAAVAPDKVVVACSECGAKLKVAETSLGKKMKCPKCASVFVAAVEKAPAVVEDPEPFDDPTVNGKGRSAKTEEDDLFAFAQEDEKDEDAPVRGKGKRAEAEFAERGDEAPAKGKGKPSRKPVPNDTEDEEEFSWQKGKAKQSDPDDDDEPKPKGKKGDKPDQKPVYPRRILLNLLVAFMMLAFFAVFVALFFGDDVGKLAGFKDGFHADLIGIEKPHFTKLPKQIKPGEDDKTDEATRAAANKKDEADLEGTWVVESAEKEGAAFEAAKGKVVFASGKVTGPHFGKASITIDASAKPKSIDLKPEVKGEPFLPGIYKFDGGKLYWCMSVATKQEPKGTKRDRLWKISPRPSTFESKDATLLVLKREGKKETSKSDNKGKADEQGKKEAAKLNGVWIVEAAEESGRPLADLKGGKFAFADGRITAPDPGLLAGAPFTVDSTKNPAWIDIKKGESKVLGIYKLDGDKLYLCADLEMPGERPTGFNSKLAVYYILVRQDSRKEKANASPQETDVNAPSLEIAGK
jgi:uncharacterized protein (TIGR03067 family)